VIFFSLCLLLLFGFPSKTIGIDPTFRPSIPFIESQVKPRNLTFVSFSPHLIFRPIIESYTDGFKSIGIEVKNNFYAKENTEEGILKMYEDHLPNIDDSVTIIFFCCVFPNQSLINSRKYIIYTWENMPTYHRPYDHTVNVALRSLDLWGNASEIWTYSQLNVNFFKHLGYKNSHLLLPGYHKTMTLPPLLKKGIRPTSIFFPGILNSRRRLFLDNLREFVPNLTLGKDYVKGTRICLNMNYYEDPTILPIHRIYGCASIPVIILSERSNDIYLDNLFKDIVIYFNSSSDFVRISYEIMNMTQDEYNKEAQQRFDLLKAMPTFIENFLNFSHPQLDSIPQI
jgi:hypothetical protein